MVLAKLIQIGTIKGVCEAQTSYDVPEWYLSMQVKATNRKYLLT